jgi:acyl dehydratase
MDIDSRFVGTSLRPWRLKVHWRDTMNYAAAIDDDNPLYFDDERQEGIIAPPMFVVAATWPVVGNLADFIEIEDFPCDILATQVHYTEHIRFHRPLKPGTEIEIRGRIAAVLPHRAGTQVVICLEAFDRNQKPVFTEHTGAMMRGVDCSDNGKGEEVLPGIPKKGRENPLRWEKKLSIDPLLPFIYDGCTNIVFPIHTSKKFARQVGLPGIILQGTATLALSVRELINREARGNSMRLKEIYCRFTGMVVPGSVIQLQVYGGSSGSPGGDYYFDVLNPDGQKAASHGYALLAAEDDIASS